MQHCFKSASSVTPPSALAANQPRTLPATGNSGESTPRSSAQPSPTFNLNHAYARVLETKSFNEICSVIHVVEEWESNEVDHQLQQLLARVLQPNLECLRLALQHARPNTFNHLASAYFNHSEKACQFLLRIRWKIHHARCLYAPIQDLVKTLTSDFGSLTQLQCNRAYDVFLQFDSEEDPFSCSGSQNFDNMSRSFSELREEVDTRRRKSNSKVRCIHHATAGSAVCLIGVAIGVTITAVAIATHALVALVAAPIPAFLPSRLTKKELVHMAQLGAAAKSAFVVHEHLDTIDRLLKLVQDGIEGDKVLVRRVLYSGAKDKHTVYMVVKQLASNHHKVLHQLTELEEHICLCFTDVNAARSLLLKEIDHNRTS